MFVKLKKPYGPFIFKLNVVLLYEGACASCEACGDMSRRQVVLTAQKLEHRAKVVVFDKGIQKLTYHAIILTFPLLCVGTCFFDTEPLAPASTIDDKVELAHVMDPDVAPTIMFQLVVARAVASPHVINEVLQAPTETLSQAQELHVVNTTGTPTLYDKFAIGRVC